MPDGSNNPYSQADFDSLHTSVEWTDKGRARIWRDTCEFEWQRTLSDRNIDRLAGEMSRGWFVSGSPIFVAVLPDSSMRLLNGNHTMEGICRADISIPLSFTYRRVKDLKEAGAIYAVLDIQKIRTWRDSLQATGKEEFPLATHVMSAMGLIMSDFIYRSDAIETNSSRTMRFERMEDYRRPAEIIKDALGGVPGINARICKRAAFLAVALETARYQPAAAHEFWKGLAEDDGLAKDDARKALLRYGQNNPARSGSESTIAARAASLAWNAFFERRPLEYCKPNAAIDFRLLGTPWSGSRSRSLTETGVSVTARGTKPISRFLGGNDAR